MGPLVAMLLLFALAPAVLAGDGAGLAPVLSIPPQGLSGPAAAPMPPSGPVAPVAGARPATAPDRPGVETRAYGRISVQPDGTVCIDVDDAGRHCDLRLRDDSLLLLSRSGEGRYRFRLELGVRP